jgi:hypothetical protein
MTIIKLLNGNMTDRFNVDPGLKQGCILSYSMFNIHVNSLIDDINALNIGIDIDNDKLAMVLYADDVVLLSENEKDLQKMLDVLNIWCKNNALYVNVNKFKIMHFRDPSVPRTCFNFTVNGNSAGFQPISPAIASFGVYLPIPMHNLIALLWTALMHEKSRVTQMQDP